MLKTIAQFSIGANIFFFKKRIQNWFRIGSTQEPEIFTLEPENELVKKPVLGLVLSRISLATVGPRRFPVHTPS